jgi:glucitol/sorbitol PTS system EIIA component
MGNKRVVKYAAKVIEIGPLVMEFIEAGILVFFGSEAPEELREFSILHDGTTLIEPVITGDLIHLDDATFKVLAVGEVANANLSALGHIIVKFNGQTAPEMPGDICTEIGKLPEIRVGSLLQITGSE